MNNKKILISLMTVFGFSVFVESNCCNGASARLHLQQIRQAKAQEAEQARQARAQAEREEQERYIQGLINENENLRNSLQELRTSIEERNNTLNDKLDRVIGLLQNFKF